MIKKAVISNMAWVEKKDLSESELFLLKKRLTIIPQVVSFDADEGVEPIKMYLEDDQRLGIPRRYWTENVRDELSKETLDISEGRPLREFAPLPLRPEDQAVDVEKFMREIQRGSYNGGIFVLMLAMGKHIVLLK